MGPSLLASPLDPALSYSFWLGVAVRGGGTSRAWELGKQLQQREDEVGSLSGSCCGWGDCKALRGMGHK